MIVVLGRPGLGLPGADGRRPLGGIAAVVARTLAAGGRRTEIVGAIGEDADGDRVAVELGRAGVGHAALLRDPAGQTPVAGEPLGPLPRLDAGDVELGLRYLTECRVLLVAEPLSEPAAAAAAAAAEWHGALVVVLLPDGARVPAVWSRGTLVLSVPPVPLPSPDDADWGEDEAEEAFPGFVAAIVGGLADGRPVEEVLGDAIDDAHGERIGG